jgi:Derlin-2/3
MRELLKEEEDELEEEDGEEGEGESMETQSGNGVVSAVQDMWVKTPPITQIYIGASMLVTLLSCAFNKNAWPKVLNFDWKEIMLGFQWWRLVTPFLFFGPLGLNYGLTIQFVWIYMAQLEKLHYNNPEEYFMLLLFGAVSLIGGYTMLGLSTKFLGHNLSTYLVYIWARVFEGTDVNVMDLFVLKAELLPWFFCAQTMILEGELPFADILGIVVGHLYHYLTQQKILVAPQFLKDAFSTPAIREKYAKFRGDFE